jgi:hypothetical protein
VSARTERFRSSSSHRIDKHSSGVRDEGEASEEHDGQSPAQVEADCKGTQEL